MKVNYKINTSKESIYNYLIHSLILEIYKNTNHTYLKENLHPGFTYNKKIKDKSGKEIKTDVEILEINEKELKTKLQLSNTTHIISYQFNDDYLTYEEQVISNKKTLDLNNKFMSFLFKHKLKKQIIKRLKTIEKYIEGNNI